MRDDGIVGLFDDARQRSQGTWGRCVQSVGRREDSILADEIVRWVRVDGFLDVAAVEVVGRTLADDRTPDWVPRCGTGVGDVVAVEAWVES